MKLFVTAYVMKIRKRTMMVSVWQSSNSKVSSDLSRRSDTFPDTEVAEHPAGQKTQRQLPPHTAQLLNASGDAQRPPPEGTLRGNPWNNKRQ